MGQLTSSYEEGRSLKEKWWFKKIQVDFISFFKDSLPLIQKAFVLNELMPELYVLALFTECPPLVVIGGNLQELWVIPVMVWWWVWTTETFWGGLAGQHCRWLATASPLLRKCGSMCSLWLVSPIYRCIHLWLCWTAYIMWLCWCLGILSFLLTSVC